MKIELRRLELGDLSAADGLRQAAGWNQTPADWRRLLALDPQGCFAAVDQKQLVGTATTSSFGTKVAWIGMVLVHPTCRNQGIGRQLLTHCLEYLQEKNVRCIKLDATPAGQILYEKLGFRIEWPLARWMRPADEESKNAPLPHRVTTMIARDWNEIFELDRQAFGVCRQPLLRSLKENSIKFVVNREPSGRLEAFGLLRAGMSADYLGPVVTRTKEAGRNVILDLLGASRRPVYWDIPDPCMDALTLATELGFVSQRPFVRMYLGENGAADCPQNLWGISDPSTG